MKKIILLFIILISNKIFSQNLQLDANLNYGTIQLANIGSYVDTAGNEYALVGTYNGLDIVNVSVPSNPFIRFSIPGPASEWREVKTYRKYAYITTEGGGGLTVADLSHLPDTIYYKQYTGDGLIAGQLNSIHALHCDTAKAFLYLYGSNINYGNSLFIDLADPWNPTYAGTYVFPSGGSDAYVHDGYVMNDTMYEAHIYSGFFAVVDVRNKSNPILLATQTTPTAFTHNTWLSVDHHTLFTTDENSGSYLTAYDISDLGNIKELSRFQTAPGSGAIVHNTQIINDYSVTSWYKEGVVIVDESHPDNPIEVAHYDTYPQGSGNGFNGDWGVDPYLPSGTIVVSDINNGLFVLTPTYVRGCYLEGTVTDSITSALLNGVLVEVLTTTITKNTNASGEFKTGTAVAGNYDIRFSKAGYNTKTITGVTLTNGVLTPLNVLLVPLQSYAISGTVIDSLSGLPVDSAQVIMDGPGLHYTTSTDVSGMFNFPGIVPETYTVYVGKWGYHTICDQVTISQAAQLPYVIAPGYYDDFTFDFGWTVNGTSPNAWERGDPVGTYDGSNTEINPENDVTNDCGTFCFVTDNGGAPYNAHDVDNGNTLLTSPVFDATIYNNPVINYYYRYLDIDGVGTPNDTMFFTLSNGITTTIIQAVGPNDPTNGNWVSSTFPVQNFITPTSNMQLMVNVMDNPPGNIVEGALDRFEITGQLTLGLINLNSKSSSLNVFPNPFKNDLTINYSDRENNSSSKIIVKDILGRNLYEQKVSGLSGTIHLGRDFLPGVYFVTFDDGNTSFVSKVVKE